MNIMINKINSLLFFCISTIVCNAQQAEKELFISPLESIPSLSANFAELRNDHFHSGLDYKTGGAVGKEVHAAADGYVYRVGVSPTGYGKAIYIRHSSGYSTVYGHLDRFRQDIEDYVNGKQYELKSFPVMLYPMRDQFKVAKGEIIAWSGNSGGSSGPHLHFEVRQSATEEPVNPLMFDLGVSDKVKPVIDKIVLYPLTRFSSVNKSHKESTIKASGTGGSFTITNGNPILVNGQIGIGIKCWDTFDNSSNRCGVYSIIMSIDSVTTYGFIARRFSFSESRYLNSHIDFPAKVSDNEYIHKLYVQPGNRLSMYNGLINRGVLSFTDDKIHNIEIHIMDAAGNTSHIAFKVKSLTDAPVEPSVLTYDKVLPFGKASDFTADGIRIHFPALSFYDTLFFDYDVRPSDGRFLSPVHTLHNEFTAVHDLFRLSIRPDTVIEGMSNKLCLAKIDRSGEIAYAGGEFRYGYVSSDVRSLGDYTITIDTVKPELKSSFISGANLSGRKSITLTTTDDFSGITSYTAIIDGVWALLEFDPKNNLLIYRPDRRRIKENTLHNLEVKVTDNRGNTTSLQTAFTW